MENPFRSRRLSSDLFISHTLDRTRQWLSAPKLKVLAQTVLEL